MQTAMQPRLLSYPELLEKAQAESSKLENQIKDLKKEMFDMSQHYLRSGWNAGFENYYQQRREVSTNLLYAERDLVRSQGRETILRKRIAEGQIRVPELVASVA